MQKTKLLLTSLVLIFSIQIVFAAVTTQQLEKDSESKTTRWVQTLSEQPGQLQGTVSGVTINANLESSAANLEIQLYEMNYCSSDISNTGLRYAKMVAIGTISSGGNLNLYKDYTIPFDIPFTIDITKCYSLLIPGNGYISLSGSSNSSVYSYGKLYGAFSEDGLYRVGGYFMEDPIVKDAYFVMNEQSSLFVGALTQTRLDSSVIPESGVLGENSLRLKATVLTPFNDSVALQVELKKTSESFTGSDSSIKTSGFISASGQVDILYSNLDDGEYHWRARSIDDVGRISRWVEFGGSLNNAGDLIVMSKVPFSVVSHQLDKRSESLPVQYSRWFQILSEEPSDFQGEILGATVRVKGHLSSVYLMELSYCQKSDNLVDDQLMHDAKIVARIDDLPSMPEETSYEDHTIVFNTPFATDPTKCYELVISGNSIQIAGSFDQGSYPHGKLYSFYRSDSFQFPYHTQDEEVKDAYFVIDGKMHQSNPVILLPGMGGSWTDNLMEILTSATPIPQNRLSFIEDSSSTLVSKANGFGYIPHVFENLETELPAQGHKVYKCPYDWRQEETYIAKNYLTVCIDKAKAETGADKVDIVAHSMGGLVAREYIQSADYRNDVEKIALVGTPNHGALNAYDVWEAGKYKSKTGSFFENFLTNQLFSVAGIKTGTSALEYIHTYIPSMKTLLPTFDYVTSLSGQVRSVDSMVWKNQWLQNLNAPSTISSLLSRITGKVFAGDGLETTSSLSSELPNPSNPLGVLTKSYPDGKPATASTTSSGDGTVLSEKSVKVTEVDIPYLVKSVGATDSKELFKHTNLPNAFHSEIDEFLTGEATSTAAYIPKEQPKSVLSISLASPAELLVIDPLGRKTGYDKVTNQVLEEIPGAIYSGVDDAEFILIINPESKNYQVKVEGNATGEFHTNALYTKEECSDQKEAANIGQTTASTTTSFMVSLDGSCLSPTDGAVDTMYTLAATTTFTPDSIKREGSNLEKEKIKARLLLPSPYKVTDINLDSIRLEKTIAPNKIKKIKYIRGSHEYGIKYLDMKFKSDDIESLLVEGVNTLTISGVLRDGTAFTAPGTIEIITKKKKTEQS